MRFRIPISVAVARRHARYDILRAANRNLPLGIKPYTMRTLDRAVFKVRQRNLVTRETLEAASFRPKKKVNA